MDKNYEKICKALKALGHEVVSDSIMHVDTDQLRRETNQEAVSYYKKMVRQISIADIVVLEVSRHSTGIGHQASLALSAGKPLIALHLEGRSPYIFKGIQDERLVLVSYDLQNVKDVLADSIDYAQGLMDVRFNFFISPRIQHYLDWVAKYKRTPRAVYLRELLERDMKENKDWKKQK